MGSCPSTIILYFIRFYYYILHITIYLLLYTIILFEYIVFQVISYYYFRKMGGSAVKWVGMVFHGKSLIKERNKLWGSKFC